MTTTGKKKNMPFDLGAAYAAKLSAVGKQVTFELDGVDFTLPTAATWTEEQLKATATKSPFDIIREALGDDGYTALQAAAERTGGQLDFLMAQELLRFYMEASGLGQPGES